MLICLDTNVVIGIINRRRPEFRVRLRAEFLGGSAIILPAIVLYELRYGVGKSDRAAAAAQLLQEFLSASIEIAPFEAADAGHAGEIRAQLERAGTLIGPFDILIAAQARRRGAVLVTANRREFDRVPGLMVTDWSA